MLLESFIRFHLCFQVMKLLTNEAESLDANYESEMVMQDAFPASKHASLKYFRSKISYVLFPCKKYSVIIKKLLKNKNLNKEITNSLIG